MAWVDRNAYMERLWALFVACAMVPPIFPRDAPARSRVRFRLRDD